MQDNNTFSNKDYSRDLLAWGVLVVATIFFLSIKPDVKINDRLVYLPTVTNLPPIKSKDVDLVQANNSVNYFTYQKIGHVTITLPMETKDMSASKEKKTAIMLAKAVAAAAGADKVLVENMRSAPWFDTGKDVFRLQAVVMRQ